jgi:glutaredoxin 3
MPEVTLYATQICPYCLFARRLLKSKGVHYKEIQVDKQPEKCKEMIQRSGRHTVPQIFIGETSIGGYDDMAALDRAGKLDPLLAGH